MDQEDGVAAHWQPDVPWATYFELPAGVKPALKRLMDETCLRNGLMRADIRGRSRLRKHVWPRQDFMLAAREAGWSLSAIARFLGKNHTTVMWGCEEARKRRSGLR